MKPDADADNVNGKCPLSLVILPPVVKPLTSSHSRERDGGWAEKQVFNERL